jgi:dGTPase
MLVAVPRPAGYPRPVDKEGALKRRADFEEREERDLAPFAMRCRLSRGRVHPGVEHEYRTLWQRDRDRVVHSQAFRRLEYKTQVFVNHEGDYYRTRLTHTLEVVQISRSIARCLGLNEDLTECIALCHDLGHGPFGHSGEDALNELMAAHGGFEHNRHGLRVADFLERKYPGFPGLNLTYEVREALAKHGKPEAEAEFHPEEAPLLEARVVDVADRIAYNHHDLDDGLTAGILDPEEVRGVAIVDRAFRVVDERWPRLPDPLRKSNAVVWLINEAVTDLIRHTERTLGEAGVGSVADVRSRADPLVAFSPEGAERQESLHRFLFAKFYSHWRVARMQEKAKRLLREIFGEYLGKSRLLPPDVLRAAEAWGPERAVCDYIASMTDREAQGEYLKLFHPFERV